VAKLGKIKGAAREIERKGGFPGLWTIIPGNIYGNPLYPGDETVHLTMIGDSQEWFRQAQYDLGTAESLFESE